MKAHEKHQMSSMHKPSIIIPVLNEEKSIESLYEELCALKNQHFNELEIIFINDGSTDNSAEVLNSVAARDKSVRVLNFTRNFGQSAAIQAGLDHASGNILIPIDGDGQNDPSDIPMMIDVLDQGYDVVSGWRRDRQDDYMTKRLPSAVANMIISRMLNVKLRDLGCSLKVYRRSCFRGTRIYGEMHRYIPILLSWNGARIAEVAVSHRSRREGQSKYGMMRTVKVTLDVIFLLFFQRFLTRPLHFFGGASVFFLGLSGAFFLWMIALKFADGISFISTPLPIVTAIFLVCAVLLFFVGILAELLVRTYHEADVKSSYELLYEEER